MIDENVPPFYVNLKVHDFLLYNCMLDSRASHNLMPKVIMDQLQLEVTRTYHDLYTFDSKKVPCLGLTKDLVVTLAQIPVKSVVLDTIVTNMPPKFGMLFASPSVHEFQDPYVVFLESDRESILFNGSVYKFSWELPFSSSLLLFISKNLWRMKKAARMLTWLHWLFHFT